LQAEVSLVLRIEPHYSFVRMPGASLAALTRVRAPAEMQRLGSAVSWPLLAG
jgi:hypothetical protein